MFALQKTVLLVVGILPALLTPARAHVNLDAPNGGQVLEVGSVYTVTWHIVIAHTPQNWDLWYSTNGPDGPWTPIQLDVPPGSGAVESVHTYDWTILAEAVSDQVRVRVRMDNIGTDYEDISDRNFTVIDPSTKNRFLRGDCNDNGTVDISDAVCTLEWLFLGRAAPGCVAATNLTPEATRMVAQTCGYCQA